MITILHDVDVAGRRSDVRLEKGRIVRITPVESLRPHSLARAEIVEGRGGALVPGLHDHHLHLAATAAAMASVDCSPASTPTLRTLSDRLRDAPGDGWIRGVGYHESVAGLIDRSVLDTLVPHRPVRIQHRGGGLWMLNSIALHEVAAALDDSADVERDVDGRLTGRLWRYDARLRPFLPAAKPDLDRVGRELARLGITGVSDATPDLDEDGLRLLQEATASGSLPVRLVLLGGPVGLAGSGPRKILLRDHDLPDYEALRDIVESTHRQLRPVAVHCVTRESLLLTLAVLDDVGRLPGDRIEHASVVPAEVVDRLRGLGVVTQPGFIADRGDDYLRDVAPDDLPHLYRHRSLLDAGIACVPSSDAPFGHLDPWRVIRAARDRLTSSGRVAGPEERVSAATTLAGFHTDPLDLVTLRTVDVGRPADLVLLDAPLIDVLAEPSAERVRNTFVAGHLIFSSSQPGGRPKPRATRLR